MINSDLKHTNRLLMCVIPSFQQVSPDQVIHAPTPVKLLREVHDKQTLVIGQEHRLDIAKEYPFSANICTGICVCVWLHVCTYVCTSERDIIYIWIWCNSDMEFNLRSPKEQRQPNPIFFRLFWFNFFSLQKSWFIWQKVKWA